jgi:hypothetical protein
VYLNGRKTTPLVLDLMKDRECRWKTKSEHYRIKTARENEQVTAEQLNYLALATEGVKLKIKTYYIWC